MRDPLTEGPLSRLMRAAKEVRAAAREGRALDLCLDVGGTRLRVQVRPARRRGRPRGVGPTPCETDILAVLAAGPVPMTTPAVLDELDRLGRQHGQTTVCHALARLAKAGLILSSRKAPRGYRLPPEPKSP